MKSENNATIVRYAESQGSTLNFRIDNVFAWADWFYTRIYFVY